jgi:hypothetical protein
MRPDTLRRLGRYTWGRGWMDELSRATGRHLVTVKRWHAGITRMSAADHYRVLGACLEAAKYRHNQVKLMVANVKNPANPDSYRQKRPRRKKVLINPWRKLAKGVVKPRPYDIPPGFE